MAIIHHYDPRVDTTYVYESKNYYDRDSHKVKSRRKLIGKISKETGELVPTGKPGRPRKTTAPSEENPNAAAEATYYKELYETYAKDAKAKSEQIQELKDMVEAEKKARRRCESILRKMMAVGSEYSS